MNWRGPAAASIAWLAVVLAALALAVWFLPWPTLAPPGPRPRAPRIIFTGAGGRRAAEIRELRAVRAPDLVALGAPPAADRAAAPLATVTPPLAAPAWPAAGQPPPSRPAPAADWLLFKPGAGASFSSADRSPPARTVPAAAEDSGVQVVFEGELAGRRVDVPDWSWERWTQAGTAWMLTLEVESDAQGRITRVLVETPEADADLKSALVSELYRQGRVVPPAGCRGRIRIAFPGRI